MRDATDCANCNRPIDGVAQKFCPACGQPTPAHRIDWHFLGHELEHSVLHMDRGIFYTLKNLMLRPGHLMRDYIEGRRAGIVKPLLLLMMMAALLIVMARLFLHGDLVGSAITINAGETPPEKIGRLDVAYLIGTFGAIKTWMNQHYTALTLLVLPVQALALKLAFGRVGGLQYPEWLVINTFLVAQTFVLQALAMPLQRIAPSAHTAAVAVAVGYGIASLVQYFGRNQNRWSVALRAAWGYALGTLASLVLAALGAGAVLWMAMRQG